MIFVDWGDIAMTTVFNYFYPRSKVPFVAQRIYELLLRLHNENAIDLNNCVFIGFSLG